MADLSRRGFIGGLVGIVAAPAIVRVASIMPVKPDRTLIGAYQGVPIYAMADMGPCPLIVGPSLYRELMKRAEYSERLARGLILQQVPIPVVGGARVGANLARRL